MALFSYEKQDFMFNDNLNSIECAKCSEQQQKYLRCSCCNEVVSLADIIKHINKGGDIAKLVRMGDTLCLKLRVRDIFQVSKYFVIPDVHTLAVNFEYNINYIESTTNDGKVIKTVRNIDFVKVLENFKENSISVKHLIMISGISNDAEVLLNVNALNVLQTSKN
jgi:hypothetical protein